MDETGEQRKIDRDEYVISMRKVFCPEEMINPETGELIEDYFQPKSTTGEEWNEEDQKRLFLGVLKHGVGQWSAIKRDFLPIWDEVAIRLKVCWLLGVQDLAEYEGWKGDENKAKAEREKNLNSNIGIIKYGVRLSKEYGLVYNEGNNESKEQ